MTAFGWSLAAVCFSLTLIIETSSWCLRARAEVTNQGLYNSRVNIYLYTARFFYLVFMVLMAWAVDRGATHHQILGVISGAAGLGGSCGGSSSGRSLPSRPAPPRAF